MIYDLIELPMRNMTGELSSVVPRFTRYMEIDDIYWFGRSIDLDIMSSKIRKYKSIEPIGNMTIERILMTPEPIDFTKSWKTSNIRIYPIMYKIFKQPYSAHCEVYRYLNGTHCVLGDIDCYTQMQTIGDKTYANVLSHFYPEYQINKHTEKLLPHVVSGNDKQNIETFFTINEFVNSVDPSVCLVCPLTSDELFPNYPSECTEDIYLKDIAISDLKPIMMSQCSAGIYRNLMSYVPVPFEINKDTTFTDDYELSRWTLNELIHELERSVYTDMYVKLIYKDQHNVHAKIDPISRYIGLTTNTIPGTKESTECIVELLRKWAKLTTRETPKSVELWKNWAEEIFITIQTSKTTKNYYFDIPTYSLTNLSFVDIIG